MNRAIHRMDCVKNRAEKYPLIARQLLEFLNYALSSNMPITSRVIQKKAQMIRDKIIKSGTDEHKRLVADFKGSEHWADRFTVRHNLRSVLLQGQAGSVDMENVDPQMKELRKKLREYELCSIFNVDKTGLFFRLLPRRTYIMEVEDRKTVRGTKNMKAKDRLTAYVCTKGDGTQKLPIALIGKSKNPRCFHNQPPPLPYFSQKNAWSDTVTFGRKFYNIFCPFVRRYTSKFVALLMDNCSAHEDLKDSREQITVFALPPNCTSVHQPMDCGIIAAFKFRYRHSLLVEIISAFEDREERGEKTKGMRDRTKGIAEGFELHVLDAIFLVERAWKLLWEQTIVRCWLKADVLPAVMTADMEGLHGKVDAKVKDDDFCFVMSKVCSSFSELRVTSTVIAGDEETFAGVTNADVEDWVCIEDNGDIQQAVLDDAFEQLSNEELVVQNESPGENCASADDEEREKCGLNFAHHDGLHREPGQRAARLPSYPKTVVGGSCRYEGLTLSAPSKLDRGKHENHESHFALERTGHGCLSLVRCATTVFVART